MQVWIGIVNQNSWINLAKILKVTEFNGDIRQHGIILRFTDRGMGRFQIRNCKEAQALVFFFGFWPKAWADALWENSKSSDNI